MSPLNIHPEEVTSAPKKKKSKTLKVMLGLAALVLVPVIGSTFAASIAINGGEGATVQFAQGQITTAGCDESITIAATSRYASDAFVIDEVTLSNFDFSACNGKTLIISAVEGAGAEVGLTATNGDVAEIIVSYSDPNGNVSCVNAAFTCPVESSITTSSFKFKVETDPIPSASIAKFLIQSS